MLDRKIYRELVAWKNTPGHKPLVIKGCRQCGKTYSATHFARSQYKHTVVLNFIENRSLKTAFDGSLAVDEILLFLTAIMGEEAVFEPYDTCIVFDEIQECPNARASLKFFSLDGRYDIIATGSLLGVSGYNEVQPISIPVGYETEIYMYPLDFEEFLWANGISEEVIGHLRDCIEKVTPVPEAIHQRLRQLLLQYVIVGGMPEAVNAFVADRNLNDVLRIQRSIVNDYRDDMMKYAPMALKPRIRECFDSIPKQLSKEYKKFQYSVIRSGSRASQYEGCLQWIQDAGIINKCYNLTIPELPLAGNAIDNEFKVYMTDIGLLVGMLEDGTQIDILNGSLYGYKGAIFENLIADILVKSGAGLYYFRKNTGLEVDFVMRYGSDCVIVECKAATGNAKSIKTIMNHPEKYHITKAIKLGDYNVGLTNGILTLPLYAFFVIANSRIGNNTVF